MIEAELPDGTVLEFPAGTSPDVVQRAVKSRLGVAAQQKPTFGQLFKQELMTSLPGGVARGVKDVIDTGARFASAGFDKLAGTKESERVKAMNEAGKAEFEAAKQATGNTIAPEIGRVGGQILATAPAVSLLGAGATAAGATRLGNAITTGGMTTGGTVAPTVGAKVADLGIRSVGSAIGGGTMAGLVNPEDAKTGAAIGLVTPGVIQAAGNFGQAVGRRMGSSYADDLAKFNRTAPLRQTLKESVDAGYVVPPNMVNPSTKNAIIESFSGKQATSQLASVRNQEVTEKLVRQSLGLADDAPLTKGALEQIRKIEGGAYQRVGALNPKAEMDLEALKTARNEAQAWFNAYNRSASPEHLAKAKELRDLAEVLEMQLESHAKAAGKDSLIPALREARKRIAKTYTVERALNDASGSVNARVLGRLHEKGKPLSDGLDTVGKFASAFPSVAQAPQQMGSPAAHNLRSMASLLMGGAGAASAGPVGLTAAAVPFVAGPASRGLMFRQGAQQALANQAAPTMGNMNRLAELLQNPEMQQMLARSAPLAIGANSGR
jgi:hypothetical protein